MFDINRIKQRAKLIRPLLIPFILYIGLLALSVSWVPDHQDSPWRYVVAIAPMLPGTWIVFGIMRLIRKLDEMERRIITEAAAFAFIFTLMFLLSFALLGLVGVSQPHNTWVVFIMSMLLVIGKFWGNWRYR